MRDLLHQGSAASKIVEKNRRNYFCTWQQHYHGGRVAHRNTDPRSRAGERERRQRADAETK